jgi:hypothetical protein
VSAVESRDFLASSALTPPGSVPLRFNGVERDVTAKDDDDSNPIAERTAEQQRAFHALYSDGGFSSQERTLGQASTEHKADVLRASCVELFRLAERASVSHVVIADWATLQGQIHGIADDDLLQQIIVGAKDSAESRASAQSAPTIDTENAGEHQLVMRCMADIAPEKIEWLWLGRIALGKLTLIGGEPGLGKSQIGSESVRTL